MNKKITLLIMLMVSTISFAQFGPVGHLNVFSEDGDRFTLILNGEIINDVPQSNLRVEDLNQPYYNAKIRFEDKSMLDISKNNLMVTDVDGIFMDVTYKIRRDKNNKTKSKMNYFSAIPVVPNFIPPSNVHVVHYGQPQPVIVQQVGGVSQTTTTTTTLNEGTSIGVGISVGGVNMGVSINDSMGNGAVSQTTTTTSSSSGANHGNYAEPTRGCGGTSCMTSGNFNAALATIKKQSFEDTKLKTAKQVITANCLNVNQVMQIANLFSFEDNKLEFAKFAYDYCIEPQNYFKLNGIFSFSTNVDELSDYVQSRQ
jgi:hypothetical protein